MQCFLSCGDSQPRTAHRHNQWQITKEGRTAEGCEVGECLKASTGGFKQFLAIERKQLRKVVQCVLKKRQAHLSDSQIVAGKTLKGWASEAKWVSNESKSSGKQPGSKGSGSYKKDMRHKVRESKSNQFSGDNDNEKNEHEILYMTMTMSTATTTTCATFFPRCRSPLSRPTNRTVVAVSGAGGRGPHAKPKTMTLTCFCILELGNRFKVAHENRRQPFSYSCVCGSRL